MYSEFLRTIVPRIAYSNPSVQFDMQSLKDPRGAEKSKDPKDKSRDPDWQLGDPRPAQEMVVAFSEYNWAFRAGSDLTIKTMERHRRLFWGIWTLLRSWVGWCRLLELEGRLLRARSRERSRVQRPRKLCRTMYYILTMCQRVSEEMWRTRSGAYSVNGESQVPEPASCMKVKNKGSRPGKARGEDHRRKDWQVLTRPRESNELGLPES